MRQALKPLVKPRELNQGGTGTSITAFTSDGTTPVLIKVPTAMFAAAAGKPSRKLRVTAYGRVTGGTTTNYTATLQVGTSATPGSNTTIEASTARAVNSANHAWEICADIIWESTSNKMQGRGWSMVANLVDAVAALDNVATGDPDDPSVTVAFAVAGTFSSGNAGNLAYLDDFTVEVLD